MADIDYPASWYAATRDATPERPSLNGRVAADVAIVGGGFAGLHTARLLAMRGLKVVLVERQRIGWGASGRNGGFVGPGFALRTGALIERLGEDHARQLYAQSQRGVEIVRASLKEMGRPDILMGWGRLSVSRTDQGPDFAERSRALAKKLGATFEPWETDQVRALLITERYFQGLHDAQGFQIHPLNLALALAADAERRGVQVHEATEARSLERRGTEWQLRTAMGEVTARHVVLAGNADLGRIHRLGAAVLPVATYVAVTGKLGPRLGEAIRWRGAIGDTRRAGDYYRIVDEDRLLWGGRITTDTREPRAAARHDAGRHPLGVPAARRHRDRIRLARHHGLRAAQDAPGRRDRARPVGLHGVSAAMASPRRRPAPTPSRPASPMKTTAGACSRRSARPGPAARWAVSARSSSIGNCRPATGGTRSARRRTRRHCAHEQDGNRRIATAPRGRALRHRPGRLSRRPALRSAGPRRRAALAACPRPHPLDRHERGPTRARACSPC